MVVSLPLRILGVTLAALALLGAAQFGRTSSADSFPNVIPLPNGWQPEGIVVGEGTTIYSGSRLNGGIYAADLVTGEGDVLVEPGQGRVAVGLSYDDRTGYLFVAGGGGGAAYVYDTATGELVEEFPLPICDGTFVNDVIVTEDAAYLTDSLCAVIYVIPLGLDGSLPDPFEVTSLDLTGDYVQGAGFNTNGIDATPDGEQLIIVQSSTGLLFNVDADTGEATTIDLGDALMTAGDGILLQGKTLYVVQNRLNQVSEIKLESDLLSGEVVGVVGVLESPDFDIPTTIAAHGSRLYVVNARFGVTDPMAEYDIVQVPD
jgi:sugar lactone lactonase YvrE